MQIILAINEPSKSLVSTKDQMKTIATKITPIKHATRIEPSSQFSFGSYKPLTTHWYPHTSKAIIEKGIATNLMAKFNPVLSVNSSQNGNPFSTTS